MLLPFTVDQLGRIRDGARRLDERARLHERQLEALIATAEEDVERALAALTRPPDSTQARADQLEQALRTQLRRSETGVTVVRRLCVDAREDQLATSRLVSALGESTSEEHRAAEKPLRHPVLVVDDYDDARDLLAKVLYDAGFMVRTASNGLEALIAAYEMRPAVIIMDVSMPVLDGVEATRLIKAIDEIRDAHVIAYTANPGLNESPVRRLFAAVLQKPAHPAAVVAMVEHCVKD